MGGVIVSIQRTKYDASSSLRIFAKIDDVFRLLALELGKEVLQVKPMDTPFPAEKKYKFTIPYDKVMLLFKYTDTAISIAVTTVPTLLLSWLVLGSYLSLTTMFICSIRNHRKLASWIPHLRRC